MREIEWENIAIYAVTILVIAALAPFLSKVPRTRGKNVVFHVVYAGIAFGSLFVIPEWIQDELFSPGGVLLVGTIWPVYESIKAVCTPGEEDDTAWLQFWITSGTLSYATEFIDEIREAFPNGGEHWYEFEFYFTLWLLLPFTDGATFIYDVFTEPYIAPYARAAKSKFEGWIEIVLAVVNTSYMWMIWFTFMSLPEEARRFVVVAVGTIYPIIASLVAVTTKEDGLDDTQWLTYWSSFSLLFVAMDYLENFVGFIPGFYSICLAATVYLFLPMFNGAEVVFRRVLVPLSGQYENMLLHDAYLVRRGMEKQIPQEYQTTVFDKAANIFKEGKKPKTS